jgi:thioredoxin
MQMQKMKYLLLSLLIISLYSCSNGQGILSSDGDNYQLTAQQFSDKIQQTPGAMVIDVRTPEEFAKGHLPNAVNLDIRNDGFADAISKLDTSKAVFVYCLSGGRSAAAARKMRTSGISRVFELQGGMMQWRSAGLPETAGNAASAGMTKEQFDALLTTDKMVLVDVYADWCAPCARMKPYLESIQQKEKDKVTVVRINADDNQSLMKQMGVDSLPTLLLFKNKQQIWRNSGYLDENAIQAHLN